MDCFQYPEKKKKLRRKSYKKSNALEFSRHFPKFFEVRNSKWIDRRQHKNHRCASVKRFIGYPLTKPNSICTGFSVRFASVLAKKNMSRKGSIQFGFGDWGNLFHFIPSAWRAYIIFVFILLVGIFYVFH